MMKHYLYDPVIHTTPPKRYLEKSCVDCKDHFMCPSNWRRTRRCPECRDTFEKRARRLRYQASKRMAEADVSHCCEVCGNMNEQELVIHHKKPIVKGGTSARHNLTFLCIDCNARAHKGLIRD